VTRSAGADPLSGYVFFAALPLPDDRIALAARGDRAAAEALCREILPRVRNLVRYLVRGDHHVDDVAQEALIAVLRGLAGYRAEGKFESWVDRIVARTTFSSLRKLRGRPEEIAVEVERASDEPGGEAYVLRRQVAAHLDALPPEQRQALVLHFAVGMTVPEIAELTGAPFETVRSRIRLGKAALRDELGGRDAR
jgi:RNA polymerase sigma-70 factor, ECF subfamily